MSNSRHHSNSENDRANNHNNPNNLSSIAAAQHNRLNLSPEPVSRNLGDELTNLLDRPVHSSDAGSNLASAHNIELTEQKKAYKYAIQSDAVSTSEINSEANPDKIYRNNLAVTLTPPPNNNGTNLSSSSVNTTMNITRTSTGSASTATTVGKSSINSIPTSIAHSSKPASKPNSKPTSKANSKENTPRDHVSEGAVTTPRSKRGASKLNARAHANQVMDASILPGTQLEGVVESPDHSNFPIISHNSNDSVEVSHMNHHASVSLMQQQLRTIPDSEGDSCLIVEHTIKIQSEALYAKTQTESSLGEKEGQDSLMIRPTHSNPNLLSVSAKRGGPKLLELSENKRADVDSIIIKGSKRVSTVISKNRYGDRRASAGSRNAVVRLSTQHNRPKFMHKEQTEEEIEQNQHLAAVYIRDALNYWDSNHYKDPKHLKLYKIYRSSLYSNFFLFVVICNLLLAWWENTYSDWTYPTNIIIPVIEFVCLFIFIGDCAFRYFAESKSIIRNGWMQAQFVIAILIMLDLIQFLIVWRVTGSARVRAFRVFRVFFMVNYNFDIRSQVRQVLSTLYTMIIPFIMLLLLYFIESVLTLVLFYEPGTQFDPSLPFAPSFQDFQSTFFTIFVLGTTENFPDVTFPSIRAYGLAVVLFYISFLLIGVYITVNLIIALVYNNYRALAVLGAKEKFTLRQQSLMLAFEILDSDRQGSVSNSQWKSIAKYLWEMQVLTLTKGQDIEDIADLYFKLIDKDNSGSIDVREFYTLCDFMFLRFGKTAKKSVRSNFAENLNKYFEHPYVQLFRASLMVINAAILLQPFTSCHSNYDCIYKPLGIFVMDNIFLAYVIVELALSIYLHKASLFFQNGWHRAHFVIVIVSLLGKILCEGILANVLSFSSNTLVLARFALFFRILRLGRIVIIVDDIRIGLQSVFRLIASLLSSFIVIFIIYYIYGILGIEFFNGILSKHNPVLADHAFTAAHYNDFVNFDSMSNAFFLLFHLQTMNNWPLTASAIIIASGTYASMILVCTFYFINSLTTLNLIIAFIIEAIQHSVKTHAEEIKKGKDINKTQTFGAESEFQIVGGHQAGKQDAKLELFKQELDD
jgi:hypothetical protein